MEVFCAAYDGAIHCVTAPRGRSVTAVTVCATAAEGGTGTPRESAGSQAGCDGSQAATARRLRRPSATALVSAKGRPRSSDDLAEAARDVDRVLLARQCI